MMLRTIGARLRTNWQDPDVRRHVGMLFLGKAIGLQRPGSKTSPFGRPGDAGPAVLAGDVLGVGLDRLDSRVAEPTGGGYRLKRCGGSAGVLAD